MKLKLFFFGPIIQLNEDDLNIPLNKSLERRFSNENNICPHCGWSDGKIITNFIIYSEIILEINEPKFIYFFYDLCNQDDDQIAVINNIKKKY